MFMEDTNFVILNIQILIRSNFSKVSQGRHCIADITKSVFLVLSQSLGKKMDLVEKLVIAVNEGFPIVTINSFETVSNVKGYHIYQGIWVPKIGETFSTEREPGNPKDKYAFYVKKNECIVGHLLRGKTSNFAKTIFYFLRADKYSICEVEITGKPANLGDGEGMQVPCKLKLTGRSKFVNTLHNSLKTKK